MNTEAPLSIVVSLTACDGYRKRRTFKTIAGARRFAVRSVGETPEIGGWYAVSADGISRITVEGATFRDLFPNSEA